MEGVAAGFTVKSGWASAAIVAGSVRTPRLLDTRRLELSDPDVPDAKQPYHDGFATAREPGAALTGLVRSVQRYGTRSVSSYFADHRTAGRDLRAVGVIVGSLIDPEQIANEHIRIHAREGQLFRGVIVDTAASCELPCSIWRERDLFAVAVKALKRTEADVRHYLTALGRDVDGSWRAEHKAAALAAWLVLSGAKS